MAASRSVWHEHIIYSLVVCIDYKSEKCSPVVTSHLTISDLRPVCKCGRRTVQMTELPHFVRCDLVGKIRFTVQ